MRRRPALPDFSSKSVILLYFTKCFLSVNSFMNGRTRSIRCVRIGLRNVTTLSQNLRHFKYLHISRTSYYYHAFAEFASTPTAVLGNLEVNVAIWPLCPVKGAGNLRNMWRSTKFWLKIFGTFLNQKTQKHIVLRGFIQN